MRRRRGRRREGGGAHGVQLVLASSGGQLGDVAQEDTVGMGDAAQEASLQHGVVELCLGGGDVGGDGSVEIPGAGKGGGGKQDAAKQV